jgi:hypothetical protein
LFRDFQTDHRRASTLECSARGAGEGGGRPDHVASQRYLGPAAGGLRPSALSAHRGASRGQRTNRCSRSSCTPRQNGQWEDDTHQKAKQMGARPCPDDAHDLEEHPHAWGRKVYPVDVVERHNATGRVECAVDIHGAELLGRAEGNHPTIRGRGETERP